MTSDNEVTIGAVRADGTLKPDAIVLRDFARFATEASPYLSGIEGPDVAIVTSQALQYSPWNSFGNAAQQRAVRAMFHYARIPAYIVAENLVPTALGHPKLVVLPSPQSLSEAAWQALLQYVREGGHLLVTGPVERDEHWKDVHRAAQIGLDATISPLMFHEASIQAGKETFALSFPDEVQNNFETFQYRESSQVQELKLEKGTVTWVAYPIEMNEDLSAVGRTYQSVASQAGITPSFQTDASTDFHHGLVVYQHVMKDSVLYIFSSEEPADEAVSIKDEASHAQIRLTLRAQHAALALIRRHDGKVLARYGF